MYDWMYDEFQHVGVDYAQQEHVDEYDPQMQDFRDYAQEAKDFLNTVQVTEPHMLTTIDLGCGTGAFALHAAQYFRHVHAVDVSPAMLRAASAKAQERQIENVTFHHSGFLRFQPPEPVDILHTKWAFHHLPDYWKQAALLNINSMLKPDGILFLSDLVFTFDPGYKATTEALIQKLSHELSDTFIEEVKIHIREEYSTFDWILQGLLERAGFTIEQYRTQDQLVYDYVCRKKMSLESTPTEK
jgi:ubiquinone/menaquinone biosynthesis C-methylase UbiE